jgi:hypothetical protein
MARGVYYQLRRDTAANWASVNPILGAGEPGWESDTGLLKVGDGSSIYTSLPYLPCSAIVPLSVAPSSPVAGQIYHNTGDHHFYGWDGSAWKQLDN